MHLCPLSSRPATLSAPSRPAMGTFHLSATSYQGVPNFRFSVIGDRYQLVFSDQNRQYLHLPAHVERSTSIHACGIRPVTSKQVQAPPQVILYGGATTLEPIQLAEQYVFCIAKDAFSKGMGQTVMAFHEAFISISNKYLSPESDLRKNWRKQVTTSNNQISATQQLRLQMQGCLTDVVGLITKHQSALIELLAQTDPVSSFEPEQLTAFVTNMQRRLCQPNGQNFTLLNFTDKSKLDSVLYGEDPLSISLSSSPSDPWLVLPHEAVTSGPGA